MELARRAGVRDALEQAGAELIPGGVRRRRWFGPGNDALFEDLEDISMQSAERLQSRERLTDDLYDEDGLPA